MGRSFACASPYHWGDRFIASGMDAFERRIEFRRVTDKGRQITLTDRIVCRGCMRAEEHERRPGGTDGSASLFVT